MATHRKGVQVPQVQASARPAKRDGDGGDRPSLGAATHESCSAFQGARREKVRPAAAHRAVRKQWRAEHGTHVVLSRSELPAANDPQADNSNPFGPICTQDDLPVAKSNTPAKGLRAARRKGAHKYSRPAMRGALGGDAARGAQRRCALVALSAPDALAQGRCGTPGEARCRAADSRHGGLRPLHKPVIQSWAPRRCCRGPHQRSPAGRRCRCLKPPCSTGS